MSSLTKISALYTHIFDLNAELLALSSKVAKLQKYMQKPVFTSPRPATSAAEAEQLHRVTAAAKATLVKRIDQAYVLERCITETEAELEDQKRKLDETPSRRSSENVQMKTTCDALSSLVRDMWELYRLVMIILTEVI